MLKFTLLLSMLLSMAAAGQKISSFENINEWNIVKSDGAFINIIPVEGFNGNGLLINYEFTGAGWCGIEKPVDIALPPDYRFTFFVKGVSPANNLEFKLIDSTGDNVWWLNQRNFRFPATWDKQVIRKRNIEFAWGPAGGGSINKVKTLQLIISAAEGGKGSVYFDELALEEILPPDTSIKPVITASSSEQDHQPYYIIDGKSETKWKSPPGNEQWVKADLGYNREFGGIIFNWDSASYPGSFTVSVSQNDSVYKQVFKKEKGISNKDFVYLKNGEARYILVQIQSPGKSVALNEMLIQPLGFSDIPNNFFTTLSSCFPKGYFPKYFNRVQSYWTIFGVNGDSKEGLINEEGAIEVDKASFMIEPFIYFNNRLITWNNVDIKQSLEKSYLPVPAVEWNSKELKLEVKPVAAGERGKSFITVRYRVFNKTNKDINTHVFLALRPYQVNPPWQFLNTLGGVSKIFNVNRSGNTINIDNKKIVSLTPFDGFGSSQLNNGEIISYISKNILPAEQAVTDSNGFGSAALLYKLNIAPESYSDIIIAVPFHDSVSITPDETAELFYEKNFSEVAAYWQNRLNKVDFKLPASAAKLTNTIKSSLAYILINRDNAAIQPGSRSYERAWIRDGALTSSALLRLGLYEEVKEYLDWYSGFQFPDGKIPCVVDKRGADPTPENDSHGEYIYAILQYYIFTGDSAFLRSKYNSVIKAVDYIEYLTSQRKTPQYQKPDSLAFYGLMPESISHEGYSAKPMHSYWDDFFTLRGLKDAVTIASVLKDLKREKRFTEMRDEFETNLLNSIRLSIKNHNINYIPGCVELGDFDATSTTISLFPGNEMYRLPQPELNNTFEKYYDYFVKRKNNTISWDAYTPYEIRSAGSFLYLGQKEKTHELLSYFFNNQRPYNWNHWAEVVWKDRNEPRFIGDMPHTWIASDYINAVRSVFVYEREYDSSLVVGAGLKQEWVNDPAGISVNNLSTYYGTLNYDIRGKGSEYTAKISGNVKIPKGGIVIPNFLNSTSVKIQVDGKNGTFINNEIIVRKLPAVVKVSY